MAVRHAGELRWKVNLLQLGPSTRSGSGARSAPLAQWAGPVPAKIEDSAGTEAPAHGSRDATLTSIVTIRQDGLARRPNPKTDAIEFGSRILNIVSVADPDQMGRWWEITCRENL